MNKGYVMTLELLAQVLSLLARDFRSEQYSDARSGSLLQTCCKFLEILGIVGMISVLGIYN